MPDLAVLVAGVATLAYALGAGRRPPARRWQPWSFAAGMAAVAVAVTGLDGVAHDSLTGHMVQHLILWSVAAPLVAAGAPLPTLLWALPGSLRRPALRAWRAARRSHDRRWPRWAFGAIAVQTLVLWGWHAPVLYDAALRDDVVHGLEHVSFTVAAVVFLWAVAGGRRAGHAGAALAVFVAGFPGTALGAGMLLAPHAWYAAYGGTGSLQDQQVAAVVMWVGMGLTYVVAAALLFARWLHAAEQRPLAAAPVA